MVLLQNKVLFIVEGNKSEPAFVKHILMNFNQSYFIEPICSSFNTNIYVLYNEIMKLNQDFDGEESTSTIEALKEICQRHHEDFKKFLDQKIAYIYLFFDLDFHDNNNKVDKDIILEKMLHYFNDETENGKLFINYPMLESYRDYVDPLPNNLYMNTHIKVCDSINYKTIVDNRGTNLNLSKYDKKRINDIVLQNIMKSNYILTNEYIKPSYNDFLDIMEGKDILNNQFKIIKKEDKIYILCTSLFFLISYYGNDLYKVL